MSKVGERELSHTSIPLFVQHKNLTSNRFVAVSSQMNCPGQIQGLSS